jgi:hypothetical protein
MLAGLIFLNKSINPTLVSMVPGSPLYSGKLTMIRSGLKCLFGSNTGLFCDNFNSEKKEFYNLDLRLSC